MTRHLGDFNSGTVIYGKFTTYRPSTGAAFTLGGTPALSVYKDNNTTQTTTGVTLSVDFDSVTGLHHYTIDTADAFYAAGSFFDIVITTGTVDSVSVVGTVVGSFTIAAVSDVTVASINANAITATAIQNDAITAAKIANAAIDAATFAADVDAEILSYIVDDATRIDASALNTASGTTIPAIVADTNELQTDWVNGGRLDLILDARASQTSVDDVPTALENADALLNRDMSAVTDSTARSPLNALRAIRNASNTTTHAGELTVFKEDDTTEAWRAPITTDAGAEPITGIDPS